MVIKARFLWGSVLLLALVWVFFWIGSWWGTVSLDFDNKALGQVLDSFTRQTQLPVLTDLDRDKIVSIHVSRVNVTEALEAIQACTESRRGRLVFLLAPNLEGIAQIRGMLPRLPDPASVLSLEYRIPFTAMAVLDGIPAWADPRQQTWKPPLNLPKELRAALESAAQTAEIRILLPADWNPVLRKAPAGGKISTSLPHLAALAGGKSEMLYLLPAPRSDEVSVRDSQGSGSSFREDGAARGSFLPPEKWMERIEPRLTILSPEDAAAARLAVEESIRQYKDWSTLPPEERRTKFEAMMQDPANAEKLGNRFMRGMRNMSPEQRTKRYQAYNDRREAVKDPGHNR